MDKTDFYIEQINKVIDYIESHIAQTITLDDLALRTELSKYHFHRIFHSFTNESLYSFINRLRVERAAALLLSQSASVTDIALSCGFNDSATFSRAFKKRFGISATEWKRTRGSKIHQDGIIQPCNNVSMEMPAKDSLERMHVQERILGNLHIAYLRHRGRYAGDAALFQTLHRKLMKWAKPKGLVNYPETKDIIIYHDPLGITENDNLRISVGITVPEDAPVSGEIGLLRIPRKKYISCGFKLHNDEYGKAWTQVFRRILPQRGLQPDEGYCFEQYPQNCYDPDTNTSSVDICVPIKAI